MLPAVPHLGFSIVDVRDVAIAHRLAMEIPEAAGQRYLLMSGHLWMKEMSALLKGALWPPGLSPTHPGAALPHSVVSGPLRRRSTLRSARRREAQNPRCHQGPYRARLDPTTGEGIGAGDGPKPRGPGHRPSLERTLASQAAPGPPCSCLHRSRRRDHGRCHTLTTRTKKPISESENGSVREKRGHLRTQDSGSGVIAGAYETRHTTVQRLSHWDTKQCRYGKIMFFRTVGWMPWHQAFGR